MSAELLELGPGAGQIEPSATGAPPPHTNQYGTSLSIYTCIVQSASATYASKINWNAWSAGEAAICHQEIDCVCTIYTCAHVWPLDRGPVCPDQHCISNSAFPEATGWPQNMQNSAGTSGDVGTFRHMKIVL